MITTPELLRLLQSEREAQIRHDHLVRIASCARACCSPTLLDRIGRALSGNPATC